MKPTAYLTPIIYLGIGGTGIKTLINIKYRFEKEYGIGNIPPTIAFVGLDTGFDRTIGININSGMDYINLCPNTPNDIAQHYMIGRENRGLFQWMHERNYIYIPGISGINMSPTSVRTNGRLIMDYNIQRIKEKLCSVVERMRNASQLSPDYPINIYMVNSLAGGTGSGGFISVAVAIKEMYGSHVNLYGFGVTHNFFLDKDPTCKRSNYNYMFNGIASIIELDYLFSATNAKPIKFEVGGHTYTLTSSVFDNYFIVDNKSSSNSVIPTTFMQHEMLGLALYSVHFIGEYFTRIEDLLNYSHTTGLWNVLNKKGWVQSLGIYEIVYKGDELAKIYAHIAAHHLIHQMHKEEDFQNEVTNWMEIVGLHKDNSYGANQLIDTICAPNTIQSIQLPYINQANSDEANKQECQKYLTNLAHFPTEKQIANLLDDFKTQLNEKVQTLLKENAAVGNALKFVKLFKVYCAKFKTELDSEVESLTRQKLERDDAFESKAYNNYIAERRGILTIRCADRNQALLEMLVSYPAREILKLSYEIKRREVASSIFNTLIIQAEELSEQLEKLNGNLKHIVESLDTDLVKMQISSSAKVFEFDLSSQERTNIHVDDSDVAVANFVETLDGHSLLDIDSDTLRKKILTYTENLPKAIEYKNVHIVDIINNLPEKECDEMMARIKNLDATWLRVNGRSQYLNHGGERVAVENAIYKNLTIIGYRQNADYQSKLEKIADLLSQKEGLSPVLSFIDNESLKQRIIISVIDGCVIPYCLDFLPDSEMEHYYNTLIRAWEESNISNHPHIDKGWFDAMQAEGFRLKPTVGNQ